MLFLTHRNDRLCSLNAITSHPAQVGSEQILPYHHRATRRTTPHLQNTSPATSVATAGRGGDKETEEGVERSIVIEATAVVVLAVDETVLHVTLAAIHVHFTTAETHHQKLEIGEGVHGYNVTVSSHELRAVFLRLNKGAGFLHSIEYHDSSVG